MTAVRVFPDAEELGRVLAREIVSRRPALLGCPGGRSLLTTYRALPELPETTIVMMDEYVPVPPPDAHYSCRGFAERELPRTRQVWLPDPESPEAYDELIAAAGGIDLFLLASGASDGHVAFLGPGSPRDGLTAVVELAETTRRDNLATFPRFASLDEVPRHGVSVGLATIAASRSARLVLHGEHKREAAARVVAAGAFDPAWPVTIVHEVADAEIWLDEAAAAA